MADDTNFSYSFSFDQAAGDRKEALRESPRGGGADALLYAVDDYLSLDVDGGPLLVGKSTGAQMMVSPEVAMVLPHCTLFRTLSEHARHLVALFPQLGGNESDALRVLELVRDAGLLVSAGQICRSINADVPGRSLDRTKAFIITCDRPLAVERLLDSVLQHARLTQHEALYLIDDSRNPVNAGRNREAVERFNLVSPAPLHYVGSEVQQRLMDSLIAAVPAAGDAVRFLLAREQWGALPTHGRARTLCLLLSVGSRCLVMDDDVLCQAFTLPERENVARFADGMRGARFFSDPAQWQREWLPADFDPLSGHARCLGMGLAQALRELGTEEATPARFRGASASLFRHLSAATPVLVTQAGTLGDPGTQDNAWLPKLAAGDVRAMLAQRGGLRLALGTRQCWLGHAAPTFSRLPAMSQITGLDNREALPPYFPVLRGEDQLFGATLAFLFPDAVVLDYDWAVPHLPLEERAGNADGDSVVPRGGMSLLTAYLQQASPEGITLGYDTRLELLAARLQELAELPSGEFLAHFRSALNRTRAVSLQTLRDRLADTGALDAQWRAYLESNVQACTTALQQAAAITGVNGVPAGATHQQVIQQIQHAATGFAAALRAWPLLREAARDFRV
jgi:hypothetical protein